MKFDAIVVGGGLAGLTAAAFLSKAGVKTLLCEKESNCGGLANSFVRDGFTYDGGIRAMENSGVLFPMLKSLGLSIEFVKNHVSIGIENKVIKVNSDEDIHAYQSLLNDLYPESTREINLIIREIRKIMHYMDVQYGIDNPIFLDFKQDMAYMGKVILPWIVKYAFTAPKISALQESVVEFLRKYTQHILEKSSMNVMKYLFPAMDSFCIGPHKSVCTNSSGQLALHAFPLSKDSL